MTVDDFMEARDMIDKIALLRAAKAMLNLHNDCESRQKCRGCVAHNKGAGLIHMCKLCRMEYGEDEIPANWDISQEDIDRLKERLGCAD